MKTRYFSAFAMLLTLFACSDQDYESYSTQLPMEFCTEYPMITRATDAGFADGDYIGIFVSDYNGDEPQPLTDGNLRASNMAFTYNEADDKWTGNRPLYWKNQNIAADVIGYYPYNSNIGSPTAYTFSIATRQDKTATSASLGGYEASDLLWAKVVKALPSDGKVSLSFKHIMAGITISLVMGDGFDGKEWASAQKKVMINNAATSTMVNLETGSVEPSKQGAATVFPMAYGNDYRAVLIPQNYDAASEIITIDIEGQTYKLTKSEMVALQSGKMHTFTIKVDKHQEQGGYTFTLVGESISSWKDDSDFHDGIVRQYVIVNVETPGTFSETLQRQGLDYREVRSMKVVGKVNADDLFFIGDMPALQSLNMKDVIIVGGGRKDIFFEEEWEEDCIPDFAFCDALISHLVLPDRLRVIGSNAFDNVPLVGTLIFPESLEEIGRYAFCRGTNLGAGFRVVFPSTLKKIDEGAFYYSGVRGELKLPNGLEEIGEDAFDRGYFITGELDLPESLKIIGSSAFANCAFTGDLVIPDGVEVVSAASFAECSFNGNLILSEGVMKIEIGAFANCKFRGELILPSTVREIGYGCFEKNDFSSVILPRNLQVVGDEAFMGCQYLMGEIRIPSSVVTVPARCFQDCPLITSVVLNKNITTIEEDAFKNDVHIKTIVSENPEPPYLDANAFRNVVKTQVNVEVPKEGLSAYKQNKIWGEFSRLTEYRNFVCRPAIACALNSVHRQTLVLNADADWKVVHQPEWVKLSKTSGSMKTAIDLTFSDMSKGAEMRTDSIVFQLEGTEVTTYCKLSQYDYQYAEDEVVTLQKHKAGNGIGIYFVGDGWDGEVIASGEYLNLCRQDMEYFFGLPPYDRLRDYFDVYAIIALSQEKGINTINTYRDTKFSTLYSFGDPEKDIPPSYFAYEDEVFPYISSLTGLRQGQWWQDGDMWKSLVVLIPNCTDYSGNTAYYDDGSTISICPPSIRSYPNDTRGTIQHEAGGHGLGKLGDELITANKYAPDNILNQIEKMHWRGWYQNLATTGIAANVPWSFLIYDQRYSNYVDIFEGGCGYTRRIWRSEANSCMNYGIPYYNAISRLDITRRVFNLAGEWFDINRDFYDVDTDEWGSTEVGGTRAAHQMEYLGPIHSHTAPVMLKRGQYNELFKKIKNRKYEINR